MANDMPMRTVIDIVSKTLANGRLYPDGAVSDDEQSASLYVSERGNSSNYVFKVEARTTARGFEVGFHYPSDRSKQGVFPVKVSSRPIVADRSFSFTHEKGVENFERTFRYFAASHGANEPYVEPDDHSGLAQCLVDAFAIDPQGAAEVIASAIIDAAPGLANDVAAAIKAAMASMEPR